MVFLGSFSQGFLLQASLILALGAQNIYVLNAGLQKRRYLLVATVSAVCDMLLIFVGVLGVASFFVQIPILKIGLGAIGVGFLFYYGLMKFKEAGRGIDLSAGEAIESTVKQTVFTALGFSLLNPHVYLDTVVLIGGYSSKFSDLAERFSFGLGAAAFSFVWFFCLVFLAAAGSRFLASPKAMRIVSLVSGLILITLSIKLALDVYGWFRTDF